MKQTNTWQQTCCNASVAWLVFFFWFECVFGFEIFFLSLSCFSFSTKTTFPILFSQKEEEEEKVKHNSFLLVFLIVTRFFSYLSTDAPFAPNSFTWIANLWIKFDSWPNQLNSIQINSIVSNRKTFSPFSQLLPLPLLNTI